MGFFSEFSLSCRVMITQRYFKLLIRVPILQCSSSQHYLSSFPAQFTVAYLAQHVKIPIRQATRPAAAQGSTFSPVIQTVMNTRRPYKEAGDAHLALHTSDDPACLENVPSWPQQSVLAQPGVADHLSSTLVRIHSHSRGTGMQHPLHNAPYPDKIPTKVYQILSFLNSQ